MYVRPPSVPHEWGELSPVCAHPQRVPRRRGLLCPCHCIWGVSVTSSQSGPGHNCPSTLRPQVQERTWPSGPSFLLRG